MNALFGVKLIFLNALRDWRKNTIASVAILIGTVSLILFGGYVAQMYEGIRLGIIHSQLGHYQIFSVGENAESYSKNFIDKVTADRVQRKLQSLPEIELVSRRIEAQGLVSFGNKSIGVLVYGVEADQDAQISSAISVVAGSGLFAEQPEGALVGKELLQELGAKLGDIITILARTADGALNAIDVKVTGVMDTGAKELNQRFIKVNLSLMQELLYTDAITNLVVLANEKKLNAISDRKIRVAVKNVDSGLTIKSWSELSDRYHQIVTMFNNIFGFMTVLVIAIIFAAIFNTMTMGVMERVSELATIRALGISRVNLLIMVLSEGLVVGIFAILMGLIVGAIIAQAINWANIPMPKPPGSTFSYPLRILLTPQVLLTPAVLSLIATLIGSSFPAYRAGKLPINEAMQR
ncbi:MAG: ABC transporter permease [Methanobacteriota archaeon]|nr:MAG: ABC transporter permease [Euryarchaeota archaeon]